MAGLDYGAMTEDAIAAAEARDAWAERMRRGVIPWQVGGRDQGSVEALGAVPGRIATSLDETFQKAKEESWKAFLGEDFDPRAGVELTLNIGSGGMPMTAKGAANTLGMFG